MRKLYPFVVIVVACGAIAPPVSAEPATPPARQQLWTKLDALHKEKEDLAWQRWQALSDVEKAEIIVKHRRQGGPTEEELAALTEEKAPGILAEYAKRGADGERQLHNFASYTIWSEESRAYQQRRGAIEEEIDALGAEAVPGLIDEIVRGGKYRFVAKEPLSRIGEAAVPALVIACEEGSGKPYRYLLMGALAGTRDSAARDTFLAALRDSDANTRREALRGLLGIGAATQEMCLQFLAEESSDSRRLAIAGLGAIGDLHAVPALLKVARTDPAVDKSEFLPLRKAAYDALKKIAERTGAKVELPPEEVLRW